MAIYKELDNSHLEITDKWEGQSGKKIEDFISRKIPASIQYTGNKLSILNDNGGEIASGVVTIEEPTYDYGIYLVGIRVDGTIYKSGSITIQVNSNTTVELAIATYAVALTSSSITDIKNAVRVNVSYNNKKKIIDVVPFAKDLFKLDDSGNPIGINVADSELKWFNIKDLFNTSTSGKISATINNGKSSTLGVTITNESISLKCTSNYISETALFSLVGGNANNYLLQGWLNNVTFNQSSFTLTNLQSGINLLVVKAVHNTNPNISTDYVYIDIINPLNLENTVYVVNNPNLTINNNDTDTLYTLTVYSPNKEAITINTYLDDSSDDSLTSLLDVVLLNSQDYDSSNKYLIDYLKYIEINSLDTLKFLKVESNGELYKFYIAGVTNYSRNYRNLTVSPINIDYIYTLDITPSINFDLIIGRSSDLFSNSNWVTESGRTFLRIEANSGNIFSTPLNLNLSDDFTLEFGFKSYNISNENNAVITFGPMEIRPTMICWNTNSKSLFDARFAQFNEKVDTHIVVTLKSGYTLDKSDPYYPDYFITESQLTLFDNNIQAYNLLRIYINDVIAREVKLTNAEVEEFKKATLQINSVSSDLDLYLLRVYNNLALSFNLVEHNYISFIPKLENKEKFFNANDILKSDGSISFSKSLGKYNSLVYVFPKDGKLPNRSWQNQNNTAGTQDSAAKKIPVTLFINYKDLEINKEFGGRITNGLVKGQGSSAMRYLIWNTTFLLKKIKDSEGNTKSSIFTPYLDLLDDSNVFMENPLHIKKNYYNMPNYEGLQDTTEKDLKITKLVGKVNFASSMQSHKEGACKLYNDAFKANHQLLTGGRKAVHEEAFLYFYIITDKESVEDVELQDLLDKDDEIKFMGFQTWGSAKGDKVTSGYDENKTPEYILLEGGENTDPHVRFLRPWMALLRAKLLGDSKVLDNFPTITKLESIEDASAGLLISDESITYDGNRGAWDVDFGLNDDATDFTESAKKSLNKFREFIDFVYKYNYNLEKATETDISKWDTLKRYIIEKSISSLSGSLYGDIYRYDEYVNSTDSNVQGGWVRAGLYYDSSTGWEKLNIFDIVGLVGDITLAIEALLTAFKKGIELYIDTDDIAFHQALIKLLSGTDNRAKNTYFLIIGTIYEQSETGEYVTTSKGDYKVRLLGDDLDTVIQTDNNGLQSKPYNLLEPSYNWSTRELWGDSGYNAFFYMFDLMFESRIKSELAKILEFGWTTGNRFEHFFYDIQSIKYPAVAYNHTALIYYETAQFILDAKNRGINIIGGYDNNLIEPIELSHGSNLEGEQFFMQKRHDFLASYAQADMGEAKFAFTSSAGGGAVLRAKMEFEPFLDFYPNYLYEERTYKRILSNSNELFEANKYLATSGEFYSALLKESTSAINLGLLQTELYRKLNITGLTSNSLSGSFDRLTEFTIDNANLDTSFFGSNYPEFELTSFNPTIPTLEKLTLRNMKTIESIDLSEFTKLLSIDFTNTTFKRVILPTKVKTIVLPSTIEEFNLYNPVESVTFLGLENLKVLDLLDIGKLDVSTLLTNIVNGNNQLEEITLRNIDISVTEETILKLVTTKFKTSGIINIIDSNGDLAEISFATKLQLVNCFGDIDNGLINYKPSTSTPTVTIDPEVNIYGIGNTFTNIFNLLCSSNLVKIISDNTPRLLVDYSIPSSYSNYITLNSRTGAITIKKETTDAIVVTVKITFIDRTTVTVTSKLYIKWQAPKVGDLIYYDGSYSSSYNPNKTLIGLIYAVDTDSLKVYIIGKEYFSEKSMYLGYSEDGVLLSDDSNITDLYQVLDWLNNKNITDLPKIDLGRTETSLLNISNITNSSYDNIFNVSSFYGKEDTTKYITQVNLKVLPKLKLEFSNISKYISGSTTYNIASLSDLIYIINNLRLNDNMTNLEISSCILYPYYYAAYLYEPSVNSGETLNELFKKNNWYIPNIGELSRIIYFRGRSSAETFNNPSYILNSINSNLTKGSTDKDNPIFSIAYKTINDGGGAFPSVWNTIAGSTNVVTNLNTTNKYNNYSYLLSKSSWSDNGTYRWISGAYNTNNYNADVFKNAWRLTLHKGVPFTEFTYTNPNE